ncbi:MAG TPA: potassium-transporting ATPase subunit F [Miltoncostaea sp.]|nr:potassium-transporting ATPase subunit F [Miltoncostaea sp.]
MGAGDVAALIVATLVLAYLLYALFEAERF